MLASLAGEDNAAAVTGTLRNKCLVLGAPGVGKRDLVDKLLGPSIAPTKSSTRVSAVSLPADAGEENSAAVVPLTLTTKYYRADIAVWIDSIAETHDASAGSVSFAPTDAEMDEWCRVGAAVVDAFVFVYDQEKPETFLPLQNTWAKFIDTVEPSVALCVANFLALAGHDSISSPSPLLAQHEEWCIEHDIEYINMRLPSPDGENAAEDDHDALQGGFRERVGIERIVEALETNVWEGMETVRGAGGGGPRGQYPVGDLESAEPGALTIEQTGAGLLSGAVPSRLPAVPQFDEAEDDEAGGDIDDDLFERSLTALQGLRDRGSSLPDNERRALAERIALLLGLDSEGDDVDDDDKEDTHAQSGLEN
ncbi:hypothetical protein HDU87_007483 [Geranomyces variabilis]|uniref:Increased recombination centers protein 6 n=1 Tax=Geranomyces variabilis TaxID=109894 RepID=A0AAD5TRP2_9FUNG|nr:hypothetical protein HDU87_007483 [Geranomyces variabilis]